MDVSRRAVLSPPPAYEVTPDNVSEVETITDASGSSPRSRNRSSSHFSRERSYSVASDILPRDMYDSHSRDSSGSSGKHAYASYTGGLITPPGSAFRQYPGIDTDSVNGRNTAMSYFSVSETDDPAVYASVRTQPYPSSILSQPVMQRSPTFPASPHQMHSPSSMQMRNGPPPPSPQMLPYNCSFELQHGGSMVLVPFEGLTDRAPMYHISVSANPFTPSSYITTIYRRNNELLARFEMGISKDEPTLFIGQTYYLMKDVFSRFRKVNSRLGDRWRWQRGGHKLHWDVRSEREILCYLEDDPERIPLARFRPAATQPPDSFSPRLPTTTLEINTADALLLDEIIVSALVVERKRTNPVEGSHNKDIFN